MSVAIECDGDRWHPPEAREKDIQRQMVLERLGWRFIRIRGSEFFRDPERTIDRVIQRLRALGIQPAAKDLDGVARSRAAGARPLEAGMPAMQRPARA